MSARAAGADTLGTRGSELNNLRRHMAIRERGDPRPYMNLGNVALIPIKQPAEKMPLVVHLGCGIFVEKSDNEVKARIAGALDNIRKLEERVNENQCYNLQNSKKSDATCNNIIALPEQKIKSTAPPARYELPPFIFDNDPHIAVVEHTAATQKRSEPRRIRSKFAIERLQSMVDSGAV